MRVKHIARRVMRKVRFRQSNARFHFIHIPKNAGQSVRDALYLQNDISMSEPFHYRYVDVVAQFGSHLRYFAVIRNPWSRTASRFQYAKQNSVRWPANDPRRKYIEGATFADFVRDQKVLPIPAHPGQPWMGPLNSWFNQLEWVHDKNGSVACDCLRLEYLDTDLRSYLGRDIAVSHRNATRQNYDYRSMYTPDLAEIIATLFREDINHFGFTFDGAATRNIYASR